MELFWGACLIWGLVRRDTRPWALLLAAKWAANYATYLAGWPWAHMAFDLVAAGVIAVWAGSLPTRRWKDLVAAASILTMLAHAWLVLAWQETAGASDLHYRAVIGLFSAQALALLLPTGVDLARLARRRLRNPHRAGGRVGHGHVRHRPPDRPRAQG